MEIIQHRQIKQKIKRLAIQILENNSDRDKIFLIGINNNGFRFAELIKKEMDRLTLASVELVNVRLNAANPLAQSVDLSVNYEILSGETLILVDDVAHTGRTLFYATKPLLEILPGKLEAAVLVDRTHKLFPIHVDYVGLSLATTLKENISVDLDDGRAFSVELD
ncbi:phosphoribosyltransferase family protein [Membranihabitans maritimus]|uniref:phosphoribosyltransferase family protein n=1 Tax=Membranihabitans maritimus TaxID=2904244 RepID=UPI001F38B820|nr:phosphoribosyltransferase family protein [Membranihabitans maritimus]